MKTVFRVCLLAVACGSGRFAAAQSSYDAVDISVGQQLVQQQGTELPAANAPNPLANQALLHQNGSLNQSSIDQYMLGIGRGNTAVISQSGVGNAAAILQTGVASRTTISQVGTGNVALSEINGRNTESDITQKGSGNRIDQRLNVDERRYSVEQMGYNNNLVQRESGSTAPGYEVSMKGNGIRVIIEQGRVATLP